MIGHVRKKMVFLCFLKQWIASMQLTFARCSMFCCNRLNCLIIEGRHKRFPWEYMSVFSIEEWSLLYCLKHDSKYSWQIEKTYDDRLSSTRGYDRKGLLMGMCPQKIKLCRWAIYLRASMPTKKRKLFSMVVVLCRKDRLRNKHLVFHQYASTTLQPFDSHIRSLFSTDSFFKIDVVNGSLENIVNLYTLDSWSNMLYYCNVC